MKFIKGFYLTSNFFVYIWGIVFLFVLGYFFRDIFFLAQMVFYVFLILTIVDAVILFRDKKGMFALRETPMRLSNGDDNEIKIYVENFYKYKVNVKIIDEIPFQFQVRNFQYISSLLPGENKIISYNLKPVKRGEYNFGKINLFVSSPLKLVLRKFQFSGDKVIPVYPSYIQMRKYELFAISNRLSDVGVKRIRRIGHSTEFEQIKEYVIGDDYRTLNWKATARKNVLMVNNYQDEKSQQVYNVIDMGRTMKMPFNGMSLLDYAINTSLVISNIALHKEDKAGVVTFSNKIGNILPAENRSIQMHKILELLYKQTTDFLESDFESLCTIILSKITHRSLILLYTNFETIDALRTAVALLTSFGFKSPGCNHILRKYRTKNIA